MNRFLVAALLALGGCGHHDGGADAGAGADLGFTGAFAAHDKVDILFMIDNSPSGPYRQEVANRFPGFIKDLQAAAAAMHPASYHIGVVTSDYGAGPYTLNNGQCHPGGDGGKLQIAPAAGSAGVSVDCTNLSLGGGGNFIDYDQIQGTSNVLGVADVPTAFSCIEAVGGAGCGFEHQLESVYRALHDPIAENVGFLRDDALLVVLFATDEDDCSAPADGDLFDPSADGVAKYGVLHSFRCTQFGVTCSDPPMPLPATAITLSYTCAPLNQADGGKLIDVQKYIDFFAGPGGVKADPSDVILASIAAPPIPFGSMVTSPCADQPNTASCPILNHSCVSATNPQQFFGDPGVRLAAVVGAASTSQQTLLCDADFTPAFDGLAQKIIARLQ
jgi:hypothetical protein